MRHWAGGRKARRRPRHGRYAAGGSCGLQPYAPDRRPAAGAGQPVLAVSDRARAMTFLYKANETRGLVFARHFAQRAPELPFRLWPDIGDPAEVRYLAAWVPPENIAANFRNLELAFSIGAGVDQFDVSQLPPHVS